VLPDTCAHSPAVRSETARPPVASSIASRNVSTPSRASVSALLLTVIVAAAALAGKTVVITGTLAAPRTQWKERLERAGATVTGAVSAKTDYLLVGTSPGSKLDAARKHGVEILEEAAMHKLLEPR